MVDTDKKRKPNKPISIAILGTRGIPARYGGFETFAEQLSTRLVKLGFAVTVYAEAEQSEAQIQYWKGVNVQPITAPRWGAASALGYDLKCLWHARHNFDLVYMLGYGAAFACFLPRWYGVPVWINVDGLEWARSKWGWMARSYLRIMEWMAGYVANRIIADAQAIADRFSRLYPGAAPCSYIAYGASILNAGVEADPSAASILQRFDLKDRGYFLVVARLEPENHVLEIVQGYQIYLHEGGRLPLVIVGDHTAATKYCHNLRSFSEGSVHFTGPIFEDKVLQALRLGARAYIHGHSVGGTNPSLLEALGCGNIVIAHDNRFNREVLGDCSIGYFRTPKDVARALRDVENLDAIDVQQYQEQARGIIRGRYTWEKIVAQYEALILEEFRAHGARKI